MVITDNGAVVPPSGGVKRGFKYRIYPTEIQKSYIEQTFRATRLSWNMLLERAKKAYEAYQADQKLPELLRTLDKPKVSSFDFVNQATQFKYQDKLEWLLEVPSIAITQKALDLGQAYTSFFKKIKKSITKPGHPNFKKWSGKQSFRLTEHNFQVRDNKFLIPKCSPIEVRWTRDLPSEPSQVTVSKDSSGRYFASFLCLTIPIPTNGQELIAIDFGVKDLCVMSDGSKIVNHKMYQQLQHKLKLLQRKHAKSQPKGKNREKLRVKIARIYARITDYAKDLLHKLTTSLVKSSKAIVIEDLNVLGMLSNHHLARHIAGSHFGLIRQMLEYKCTDSAWCNLVIADRFMPSTNQCSACGLKPSVKLTLDIRKWTCEHCQAIHDRDHNAALNLLKVLDKPGIKADLYEHPGSICLVPRRDEICYELVPATLI